MTQIICFAANEVLIFLFLTKTYLCVIMNFGASHHVYHVNTKNGKLNEGRTKLGEEPHMAGGPCLVYNHIKTIVFNKVFALSKLSKNDHACYITLIIHL